MGEFLAIVALIFFSINVIVTKVASTRVNMQLGFLISVTVNVVFSFLLLMGEWLFYDKTWHWEMAGFLFFLFAGFFNTFLGRWFFFDSIAILGPAKASTFQVSNPLFTVLISWIFLGEKLPLVDLLFIFIVLFGLLLVSFDPKAFSRKQVAAANESLEKDKKKFAVKELLKSGIFLAFFSTLSYAVGNVFRGAGIRHWNEPILGGLIGATMGLVLHFATNSNSKNIVTQMKTSDTKGILYFSLSGILTISAQIMAIASMRYIDVSISTLITLSTPILVTPLSYFLLKNEEGITRYTVIGIAMVLAGISMIILV